MGDKSRDEGGYMQAARIIIYNQDGESQEVEGFAEASRVTGLSISWIREMIANGRQSDSGYSFDYHPDYIHNNTRYLIELTDPDGCVYEEVTTVVQASSIMGVLVILW